jgi:hypothetical protein
VAALLLPPSLLGACWARVCHLRTLFVNCCVGWDGREGKPRDRWIDVGTRETGAHYPDQKKKEPAKKKRRADGQTGVYIYIYLSRRIEIEKKNVGKEMRKRGMTSINHAIGRHRTPAEKI